METMPVLCFPGYPMQSSDGKLSSMDKVALLRMVFLLAVVSKDKDCTQGCVMSPQHVFLVLLFCDEGIIKPLIVWQRGYVLLLLSVLAIWSYLCIFSHLKRYQHWFRPRRRSAGEHDVTHFVNMQ